MTEDIWLKRAAEFYSVSTTYLDSNYRGKWEDSLRLFQSKHPQGSKYLTSAYKYRSKGFRPKTRANVRNMEAAAAAAFFANQDIVDIAPQRPGDPQQQASAEIWKEVLQYRLTKTIPWFLTVVGGIQDTSVYGVVASYQDWEYEERRYKVEAEIPGTMDPETGMPLTEEVTQYETVRDQPICKLIAPENLRIHPSADWIDPIGTSPAIIELVPMYVMDVRAKMTEPDPKTGEPKWKKLTDEQMSEATKQRDDSTRSTREEDREEVPDTHHESLSDFDIVWVHRVIMRSSDGDVLYYTLGNEFLLSDPVPLDTRYPQGRPYTLGYIVLEAHKFMPDSPTQIGSDLQAEINEIANQRRDNVKLVLNKQYRVRRGAQVDLQMLTRNVPGGVVLMNDPNTDVVEAQFPDVTGSSYQEQDRLNADFDELLGNFSIGSVQTNRKLGETVGGMQMMRSGASTLQEYSLRVFAETWVEPTLRQILKLEQAFETDETILAIAAEKAQLLQRFGTEQATDEILEQELTLTVNVGIDATDPVMRVQRLLFALQSISQTMANPIPGLKGDEVVKEVFGRLGYKDGSRFIEAQEEDPRIGQLMQMVQQLQAQLQGRQQEKQMELQGKMAQEGMKQQNENARLGAQMKNNLDMKLLDLLNPVAGEKPNG